MTAARAVERVISCHAVPHHMGEHERETTVTCEICGETFESEDELRNHVYAVGIVD